MRTVTARGADGVYRSGPAGAWWLNPQPSDGELRDALYSETPAAVVLYPFFAVYVRLTGRRFQRRRAQERVAWQAKAEAQRPGHRAAIDAEHAAYGCQWDYRGDVRVCAFGHSEAVVRDVAGVAA